MNLPAYQEWRRLYLARKGVADYGAAPEKGIHRGQYSELMTRRLLQRSDGVRPKPRGNPAQNRPLLHCEAGRPPEGTPHITVGRSSADQVWGVQSFGGRCARERDAPAPESSRKVTGRMHVERR